MKLKLSYKINKYSENHIEITDIKTGIEDIDRRIRGITIKMVGNITEERIINQIKRLLSNVLKKNEPKEIEEREIELEV